MGQGRAWCQRSLLENQFCNAGKRWQRQGRKTLVLLKINEEEELKCTGHKRVGEEIIFSKRK